VIDTVADVAIVAERFAVVGQENKHRWVSEGPQQLGCEPNPSSRSAARVGG